MSVFQNWRLAPDVRPTVINGFYQRTKPSTAAWFNQLSEMDGIQEVKVIKLGNQNCQNLYVSSVKGLHLIKDM